MAISRGTPETFKAMTSLTPLRDVLTTRPLRPFDVSLANGPTYTIPHPDFLWIPPRGETIHIQGPNDDRVHIVDVLMIAEIAYVGQPAETSDGDRS